MGKNISLDNINNKKVIKYTIDDIFHSFSHSKDEKEIYACHSNIKAFTILNFSSEKFLLILSITKIIDKGQGRLNKCIEISNQNNKYLATADSDNYIYIWNKEFVNGNLCLNKINTILFEVETKDLLSVDNNYFIGSQPHEKTITFFNTNNFQVEKIMKDINCRFTDNSLLLLKNYIIINCRKGIDVIDIKTKEIIQYIDLFYSQEIVSINDKFFYLLTYSSYPKKKLKDIENNDFYLGLRINKMEMIHGYFKENGFQDVYGGNFKNHLYLPSFTYFGAQLYIWDVHDYVLEEFNIMDKNFIES